MIGRILNLNIKMPRLIMGCLKRLSTMFYLLIEADETYMFQIKSPIEEIKNAMLRETCSNNAWIEYNIGKHNEITLCVLSGPEMYNQVENFMKVLKKFDCADVKETSCFQLFSS